jgi:cytochrome c553
MKKSIGVGLFGLISIASVEVFAAEAFEPPEWAYPIMEEGRGRGPDDGTLYTREGSDLELTQTEINNRFSPVDWYPNEHPSMPDIVAHGRQPDLWACDLCHLPTGAGHPESANLSGLPANYIFQQMKDFASGARKSILPGRPGIMVTFAAAITDEEIRIAAEYFSSLPPAKWNDVVEVAMVPETFVGAGNMRHPIPGGGMEPIGLRIIEIPTDSDGAELRDTHSPFIAYVPPGTLAKGEELATTGGGKTIQCAICHGPNLKGLGDVPSLAGRSPIYLARQMFEIKHGSRAGSSAALMQGVVANLTEEDVLNLAAYAGSLEP